MIKNKIQDHLEENMFVLLEFITIIISLIVFGLIGLFIPNIITIKEMGLIVLIICLIIIPMLFMIYHIYLILEKLKINKK